MGDDHGGAICRLQCPEQVEQELRSDLPSLELDRDQMKQAFYNVIKNSLEAMKHRGILRIRSDMDEPRSEPAQAALAEALTKAGVAADPELAQHAEALRATVDGAAGTGGAAIEVGDIFGKVNVLVNNLVATGRIKLGDIRAETGDATLTNLTAGAGSSKKT